MSIFINLLGALRAFDIIYVLTGGGPVRSTETVGYFMYRELMTQFKLGYGAAATVVLLIAVLIGFAARHHSAYSRCEMIGKTPRWTIWVVGVIACIWVIPILGIVVTSIRPPQDVADGVVAVGSYPLHAGCLGAGLVGISAGARPF